MTSQNQHGSGRSSADNNNNSFPNPQDISDRTKFENYAPSLMSSSKMTDMADDEDAGKSKEAGAMAGSSQPQPPQSLMGRLHGLTGPVGEPGLPPSRPSSAATAKSGAYSQAASRRYGSKTGSVGGASTRPPTSGSRTHVPSLTSSAFFKPMSSQRLQAQRSQRPMSFMAPTSAPMQDISGEFGQAGNRQSNGSGHNLRGAGLTGLHHEDRPNSRGTDITDMPDRNTANNSPEGAETVRSRGESEAPLSGPDIPDHKPTHLDLTRPFKNSASNSGQPQKSPRSFRSSFALPARNSRNSTAARSNTGHEKLESNPSTPRASQRAATKAQVKKELGKNYEYFTGNTIFFFGGRMQNARERPINVATGLAMVLPATLFFVFSAPWLWEHVSPAIPITFAYIFLICFSSFVHASLMNPGILPRNLHPFPPPDPSDDPLALGPTLTEWTMVVSATSATAAMEVPTKYCKTCSIWRPARAHHCRTCDNCIETQDHHCVWLNNCVGRRNYRHFFTFVAAGTIVSFYLCAASLAHIIIYMNKEGISFSDSINKWRVPFAMVFYGFIIGLYPLALSSYHLGLMGRGETTREYLQSHKFLKKDRHRPFTQGNFWKNWVAVLVRPRPPTYLHFKKQYEEGDRRFGEKRGAKSVSNKEAGTRGVEMQKLGGFQGPTGRVPTTTATV